LFFLLFLPGNQLVCSQFSNWLIPVPNNQLIAMFKLCSSAMTAELSVIKKHSTTKIHIHNARSIGSQKPLRKGFINNQAKLNELQKIKKAELLLCGVLSEHNLSFNVIDHITAVCKVAFDDSKIASGINLGRTKATSIVKNVIGISHSEEIANILKSTYFSLIIDESTDVGCVKTCICVKFFDVSNDKFQTKFFKLIQLFTDSKSANEGATAEKLFDELLKAFNESEFHWIT